MSRFIKHIALWLLLVPWLASSLWFWLDGLMSSREFHAGMIVGVLPFAMAYGVVGMLLCMAVTFPLGLVSGIMFARSPEWLHRPDFRRGFTVSAAAVGLGMGTYGNTLLNTGRVEYLLLMIGFAAGTVLALLTLRLWQKGNGGASK